MNANAKEPAVALAQSILSDEAVIRPLVFLEGCEPEPDNVPDLVKHHKAEIKKLEALLKASK